MNGLIVHDVWFSAGSQPVLKGVTFEHDGAGVFALLGPSGSGKTTLLWLLAGLLQPTSGRIAFPNSKVLKPPRLGFVFQDGGLWEHLSVRGHLEIVLSGSGDTRRSRRERMERVLAETELAPLAARRPGQLSGGERQRLALARALVADPDWLLLDEPTSQLDGPSRSTLIDLLDQQLQRRRTGVILATHQVDLALRLGDRLAVLQEGRIGQIDAPAAVYERPANLAIANLLGPAFEVCGCASGGVLTHAGHEMLRGLPPADCGERSIILRPHDVYFEPHAKGTAIVRECYYAGNYWQLELSVGMATRALAASKHAVSRGTSGRLHLHRDSRRPDDGATQL